ncbi:hypothetical protein HC251_05730 [Iamia sp. SCSIO 61187]|uniref:hypothetical protein n=1 Tax=Iamia sp. SCSIO 61187 TaxID=2722752 RepID=UPI001C635D91|nr:hypothetical protein [Iamia sp. SCSIO 61187]QYG91985.1 hypothetical protein HC251_05730 [Iamia sp. SCSIO 61187]
MADPGVIALDPARLHGLEAYLQGLADGCRRRAGRVADEVAGAGVAADASIGELRRLAAVCDHERAVVAWSRALVEALPEDLPLPALSLGAEADLRAAAEALADRIVAAMDEAPPDWERLRALLAQLDRRSRSAPFLAAVLTGLGGRRTRTLPILLDRAAAGAGVAPTDLAAAQDGLTAAVHAASTVEGDGELSDGWLRGYTAVPAGMVPDGAPGAAVEVAAADAAERVEEALRVAGWGAGVAHRIAAAVGRGGAAVVLSRTGALVGLVRAPFALDDGDGLECDVPQAAAGAAGSVATLVGAGMGPGGLPVIAAGVALTGLAAVFSACEGQEERRNETTRRVDPTTGREHVPSGHATNPHVDAAGVPLPPAYG